MVSVRPLRGSDREQWLRLWRGYQACYETNIAAHTSECVRHRPLSTLS